MVGEGLNLIEYPLDRAISRGRILQCNVLAKFLEVT
jgi:hypothetical protein